MAKRRTQIIEQAFSFLKLNAGIRKHIVIKIKKTEIEEASEKFNIPYSDIVRIAGDRLRIT